MLRTIPAKAGIQHGEDAGLNFGIEIFPDSPVSCGMPYGDRNRHLVIVSWLFEFIPYFDMRISDLRSNMLIYLTWKGIMQ